MEIIVLSVAMLGAGLALLSAGVLSKKQREEAYDWSRKKHLMTEEEIHGTKDPDDYGKVYDRIDLLKEKFDKEHKKGKKKLREEYESKISNEKTFGKFKPPFGKKRKEYEKKIKEHEDNLDKNLKDLRKYYKQKNERLDYIKMLDLLEQKINSQKKDLSKRSTKKKYADYILKKDRADDTPNEKKILIKTLGVDYIYLLPQELQSDSLPPKEDSCYTFLSTKELSNLLDEQNKHIKELIKSENTPVQGNKIDKYLDRLSGIKYAIKQKSFELDNVEDFKFKNDYLSELESLLQKTEQNFDELDKLDDAYKTKIKKECVEYEEKRRQREKEKKEKDDLDQVLRDCYKDGLNRIQYQQENEIWSNREIENQYHRRDSKKNRK